MSQNTKSKKRNEMNEYQRLMELLHVYVDTRCCGVVYTIINISDRIQPSAKYTQTHLCRHAMVAFFVGVFYFWRKKNV